MRTIGGSTRAEGQIRLEYELLDGSTSTNALRQLGIRVAGEQGPDPSYNRPCTLLWDLAIVLLMKFGSTIGVAPARKHRFSIPTSVI